MNLEKPVISAQEATDKAVRRSSGAEERGERRDRREASKRGRRKGGGTHRRMRGGQTPSDSGFGAGSG